MPAVSVIIPVYNTEKDLRRCLDSICNQTLSDIEIICINDCSPDNSLDILNEYKKIDKRVKIINFPENRGVSVARNTGINIAKGQYIGFVDSDDWIDINFYEKLYQLGSQTNADAVKGNLYLVSVTPNIDKEVFYNINDKVRENCAYFCYSFTTAIYRKKFLITNDIKFPEHIICFEDPYFSILAIPHYNSISVCDEVYYYYCENSSSVTQNVTNSSTRSALLAMQELLKLIANIDNEAQYLILNNFLLSKLLPCINNTQLNKDNLIFAYDILTSFYINLKHKETFFDFRIKEEKITTGRTMAQKIRKMMEAKNA